MKIYEKLFSIQQSFKSTKDSRNNFGGYNYRNIEKMLADLKPLLSENGLILTFREEINITDSIPVLCSTATLIDNEDGEKYETSTSILIDRELKGMCTAQASGASLSYIRKYLIQSLLAIDDGSLEIDSMDFTSVKNENIVQKIDGCTTLEQLNELYKSIDEATQTKYKKCFTFRKNKLKN